MATEPLHARHQDRAAESALARLASQPATAVTVIWACVVLSATLGPDMVTGSQHEHLPIGAMTIWVWASVATAYLLMGARGPGEHRTLVAGTCGIWCLVLAAVFLMPSLVTGTDPTTIPVAVFLAPVAGAIATGFLALGQSTRQP